MIGPLDIGLSPEAKQLMDSIRPRILARLEEVNKIPVSVLIWGPGYKSRTHSLADVRLKLRRTLREKGHAAYFSEELCDPELPLSVRTQQLTQAQEFDLIVSIPCTPGAIGEVHDFAADRRVTGKMLVFVNKQHLSGYSTQSLQAISTLLSCHMEYYPSEENVGIIEELTYNNVQRIREMKYIFSGRY